MAATTSRLHRFSEVAMNRSTLTAITVACLLATSGGVETAFPTTERVRETIVGLPCEGCEVVFDGLPTTLASRARLAPEDSPGQPMRIEGTVRDRQGRVAPGVIVYAYHTDARGLYPRDPTRSGSTAFRHGGLRNWVQTDEQGRYRFDTIRPAGYPDSDIPAHVHMHVIEPGRCTYYIDDILFEDDPRLTAEKRGQSSRGRGGLGIVMPKKDDSGTWVVKRDIVLGERIPGYPAAPRSAPSENTPSGEY